MNRICIALLVGAAFSQYPRAREGSRQRGRGDIMGYAVRTDRYRYVEWRDWSAQRVIARELYDHQSDPHETHNVAALAGQAAFVEQLSRILARGWKAALPR